LTVLITDQLFAFALIPPVVFFKQVLYEPRCGKKNLLEPPLYR
jgi:hypothetical protein